MSKTAAGKRVQLKKEGLGDAPVEPKLATKKKVEEETPGGWTEPVNIVVKPAEQLDLTEKELATEVTRILSAKTPAHLTTSLGIIFSCRATNWTHR